MANDVQRIDAARRFVRGARLPQPRVRRSGGDDEPVAEVALQTGQQQAAVVGSGIVSFAAGVPAEWRADLMNSALLAQLVAKQQVPQPERLFEWYDAYFDTLAQLGWAVQDRGFAIYVEQGQSFAAHEAILKIAATALAPAAGALELVKTTLDSLRSMEADSPWLTLFAQESRQAQAARFQVSVAEQASERAVSMSLLAFGLEARASMTQVLFFKAMANQVTLRHCSGRMSVDMSLLEAIRGDLQGQLVGHAKDFIRTLPKLQR